MGRQRAKNSQGKTDRKESKFALPNINTCYKVITIKVVLLCQKVDRSIKGTAFTVQTGNPMYMVI